MMMKYFKLSTVGVLVLAVVGCSESEVEELLGPGEEAGLGPVADQPVEDTSQATDLCDGRTSSVYLSEDRTLTDRVAGTDYVVNCYLEFRDGRLTIESGTEIVFGSSSGLAMVGDSEIRALGGYEGEVRAEPSIVFKGDSVSGQPSWNGIFISSGSIDNYLENVEIRDAGFQSINPIFFNRGASALLLDNSLTIKGLTIENSGEHGIYGGTNADFGQMQDVVIGETVGHPMLLPTFIAATQLTETVGNILFTSADSDNFQSIGMANSLLNFERLRGRSGYVFENLGIPYFSYDGFFGNGEVSIVMNSGTEFIIATGKGFASGGGNGGRFSVNGTTDNPVVFRGAEALAGFWNGLEITSSSPLNGIDHAVISDAADGVFVNGDLVSITMDIENTRIDNTSGCAIRLRNGFGRPVTLGTSNNTYTNNGEGSINDPMCLGNFED